MKSVLFSLLFSKLVTLGSIPFLNVEKVDVSSLPSTFVPKVVNSPLLNELKSDVSSLPATFVPKVVNSPLLNVLKSDLSSLPATTLFTLSSVAMFFPLTVAVPVTANLVFTVKLS